VIAWMLYTVLVGLCVVVAASAADWLARLNRRRVRLVWIGAAVLCVVLGGTASLRARPVPRRSVGPVELPSVLIQTSMQSVQRNVPAPVTRYVLGLWAVATVLVTASFASVYVRLGRARRRWPAMELHGHRVRVAPAVGPVVIGIVRPQIIVPKWLLERSPEEQRVILAHEASHVQARDPMVLAAACGLVALMPWNPALWIILSRVSLAIEIDCDARVLQGGVSPRAYGSLLVDVAERASPLRLAMIALSDDSSHLHRRILAMQPLRITHPHTRSASAAFIGLAGLLAACEAKMPTAADIDRMDVASAERSARALGVMPSDSIVWTVDGTVSSEAAAKAIPHDSIADISMNGLAPDDAMHIYVVTKRGEQLARATNGEFPGPATRRQPLANGKLDPITALESAVAKEQPLIIIDGVRSEASAFKALDRSRIAAIEIRKGATAIAEFGQDAKNGVIIVRIKPAQ
jgi:bla regulator protein blaR1